MARQIFETPQKTVFWFLRRFKHWQVSVTLESSFLYRYQCSSGGLSVAPPSRVTVRCSSGSSSGRSSSSGKSSRSVQENSQRGTSSSGRTKSSSNGSDSNSGQAGKQHAWRRKVSHHAGPQLMPDDAHDDSARRGQSTRQPQPDFFTAQSSSSSFPRTNSDQVESHSMEYPASFADVKRIAMSVVLLGLMTSFTLAVHGRLGGIIDGLLEGITQILVSSAFFPFGFCSGLVSLNLMPMGTTRVSESRHLRS